MNREILFRGKSIISNEWLYGNLITSGDNHFFIVPFDEIEEDGHHIRTKDNYYEGHYAVEPKSLGQYTGLKDKNGVRIFEGDIVNACYDCGVIEFNCGVFGINWDYGRCDKTTMYGTFGQRHNLRRMDDEIIDRIEIIGNIYDNPELLKTK